MLQDAGPKENCLVLDGVKFVKPHSHAGVNGLSLVLKLFLEESCSLHKGLIFVEQKIS